MSSFLEHDNPPLSGAPDFILHEEGQAAASSLAEEVIARRARLQTCWEAAVLSQKMTRSQAIRCHPDREVRTLRAHCGFSAPHWPAPPTLRLVDLSHLDESIHPSPISPVVYPPFVKIVQKSVLDNPIHPEPIRLSSPPQMMISCNSSPPVVTAVSPTCFKDDYSSQPSFQTVSGSSSNPSDLPRKATRNTLNLRSTPYTKQKNRIVNRQVISDPQNEIFKD